MPKNQEIFELQLWDSFSDFKLISPKENWPPPKKGKWHAASSLNLEDHFEWVSFPLDDQSKFQDFITSFDLPVRSRLRRSRLREYDLHIEIQRALADIYRSNICIQNSKQTCVCMCVCVSLAEQASPVHSRLPVHSTCSYLRGGWNMLR